MSKLKNVSANPSFTKEHFSFSFFRRNGIYPLTAFGAKLPPPPRSRAISPEMAESVKSVTPEPVDIENRKIVNMMCDVKSKEETCDLVVSFRFQSHCKIEMEFFQFKFFSS